MTRWIKNAVQNMANEALIMVKTVKYFPVLYTAIKKDGYGSWRDGTAVKRTGEASRGLEFNS